MFNRPPGAMLSLGHTHQWRKGRNCSRVLSQHTAAIGTPTVTVCSIRAAGGTAFFQIVKTIAAILRAKVRRAMDRFHSFGQQTPIEISQRTGGGVDVCSHALEEILQIMVMVDIETAQCRQLLGMLQLSSGESVFCAAPRLQG